MKNKTLAGLIAAATLAGTFSTMGSASAQTLNTNSPKVTPIQVAIQQAPEAAKKAKDAADQAKKAQDALNSTIAAADKAKKDANGVLNQAGQDFKKTDDDFNKTKTAFDLATKTQADAKTVFDLATKTQADTKTVFDLATKTQADTKTAFDLATKTQADAKTAFNLASKTLNDAKAALAAAKTQTDKNKAQQAVNEATNKFNDANTKLNDANTKLNDANTKLNDANTKLNDAKIKFKDATTKFNDANSKFNDATSKLNDATAKLNVATTKRNAAQQALNKASDQAKAVADNADKTVKDAENAKNQAQLEAQNAAQKAQQAAEAAKQASDWTTLKRLSIQDRLEDPNFLPLIPNFQALVQKEGKAISGDKIQAQKLDLTQLFLKQGHNVRVWFLNEGAGYKNQLAYEAIRGDEYAKGMIFEDVSCNSLRNKCELGEKDGVLDIGDFVDLGNFKAGTQLNFLLKADGYSKTPKNGDIYGSDASLNSDGLQHLMAWKVGDYLMMGFEDLRNGGDKDYNDVVFAVDFGKGNYKTTAVPEPSAAGAILGLGALGILKLRRRRQNQV